MAIIPHERCRIIIETDADAALDSAAISNAGVESVLTVDDARDAAGWISAETRTNLRLHPWDAAHKTFTDVEVAGLESTLPATFVEPDFVQSFPVRADEESSLESADVGEPCRIRAIDGDWPPSEAPFGWHLGDDFSGLKSARDLVGNSVPRILVGILDTGFDPNHSTLPTHLRLDLARNFTDEGTADDAVDPASAAPFTNPGHGAATLALLAGARVNPPQFPHFDDFLGGAPHVDVVPIRIADSVVHFRTSSMAAGIEYAANIGCQVVSISMGGVPSAAWAVAVNKAYEHGVAIFAAAGNRIGPLPPATLVYPARFARVVAVCGFTADKEPYYLPGFHRKMHGCFGPSSAMDTAIAAYTPNIPWAAMGCGKLINPDGAGTSSATPQSAAAASLWLQRHASHAAASWKRVEAVRDALFQSADRSPPAGPNFFGNGLLRACDALDVEYNDSRAKSPIAEVSFPWLRLIGALEAAAPVSALSGRQRMFETESLQLYLSSPRLQAIAGGADPISDQLDERTCRRLITELGQHRGASKSLRAHLQKLGRARVGHTDRPSGGSSAPFIASYERVSRLLTPSSGLETAEASSDRMSQSSKIIGKSARRAISSPRRRAEMMAELVQAMRDLKAESKEAGPDIMASPQNRLASILQTALAEHVERVGASDLEFPFDPDDIHEVMDRVIDHAANIADHAPMRPDSSEAEEIGDPFRIGIVGDFGTGLYGAPVTAATIKADPERFDLLLHLGDVYYSGERNEVQTRLLDVWPSRPEAMNRMLNGNHDMYSGGYGYFELALPTFGQDSSYFAMQNDNWTLIFLDTAYKENNLDRKQVKWIHEVAEQAEERMIVLFSHHPLFSNFKKKQGVKLAKKLHDLLESQRITAWYWGHEHHCVIYDPHPSYGFLARCIGNGSMPALRKDLDDYDVVREIPGLNLRWKRIAADLTPPGLILDGPNIHVTESPDKFLPHAFATIELQSDKLTEKVFSPRGELLYSGEIRGR